ncbi:uncharacterized protein LOC128229958 isoform X3 [Mya arenaria]|uniref:uncharacterized protein LOC128229958 isoform X3 n=1 Tax=Mya arenaria TaxID=6604 RepID=UPI0022E8145E|nr:uncharacterized protein LOC128229958 isoform X3 [Mya arenaria]
MASVEETTTEIYARYARIKETGQARTEALDRIKETVQARTEALNRSTEALNRKSEELRRKSEELRRKSEELIRKSEELRRKSKELPRDAVDLQRLKEVVLRDADDLKRFEEVVLRDADDLKRDADDLKRALGIPIARQEDQIKKLVDENLRYMVFRQVQEITIRQLKQENERTEGVVKRLQEKQSQSEEEVKRLKENQSQQKNTIRQLEEENERQEVAIKQLEHGKGRAEEEVKLLTDKQSEATEEGERHKEKLLQFIFQAQEITIRQLVQEKERTEEEVKRLKENQSQHTITIRQLEEKNERQNITITQLEEKYERQEYAIKQFEQEKGRKGTNVQIPPEEVDAMRIPEQTERSGKGIIGQEPEWNVAIDTENIAGIKKLVNDKKPPPTYNTFRRAVHILHDRTVLISLCRLVSEDILTLFDRTKIIKVYAATTDNKLDITFIVVSRCSVPVPAYNGYPVLVKNISNAVLEDKAVDDAVFQMSTSDKEKLRKVKQELKSNLPTLRSAIKDVSGEYSGCPNISQMTFSTVKARNFSYKDKTVYTVDCEPALCIVIYVYFKGWIPFGWESFPDTMGGYPTDVREFYELKVQVMTDLQCRTFPCYVYEIKEITTQGLLRRQSDMSEYGLTCAHSLVALEKYGYKSSLSLDEDEDYVALDKEDLKQMIPDINVRVERLAHGTLKKPDENIEAFVDVAAVLINPQSDHLTVGLSRLIHKAFKHRHAPQFHYSEADAVVHEGDIVLKFGNTTELTFGTIKEQETFCTRTPGFIHVLGAYDDETKTTRKPFSDNGDSGALVFKVNRRLLTDAVLSTMPLDMNTETESEQLIPIGMVYGSPVGDETVTYCTQMTPCLKALGNEYTFLENQEI